MVDFIRDRIYGSFVWDREKELANIKKHGVDFETAVQAFKDIHRKINIDEKHAKEEDRFFCVGKVKGKIMPAERDAEPRVTAHPFFGMKADDARPVEQVVAELRGGRFRAL